jgi:acid phosphatase
VRPAGLGGKPAIVLDIDETSLSNYDGLNATNFSSVGTAGPAALGTGRAIAPTLELYRDARSKGVAVFFVTGRPDVIKSATEANLKGVGYDRGWDGLFFKPGDAETEAFKSSTRADLERQGYDIVVNLGDQESDLDGGHAERGFKLPNPFYFISD